MENKLLGTLLKQIIVSSEGETAKVSISDLATKMGLSTIQVKALLKELEKRRYIKVKGELAEEDILFSYLLQENSLYTLYALNEISEEELYKRLSDLYIKYQKNLPLEGKILAKISPAEASEALKITYKIINELNSISEEIVKSEDLKLYKTYIEDLQTYLVDNTSITNIYLKKLNILTKLLEKEASKTNNTENINKLLKGLIAQLNIFIPGIAVTIRKVEENKELKELQEELEIINARILVEGEKPELTSRKKELEEKINKIREKSTKISEIKLNTTKIDEIDKELDNKIKTLDNLLQTKILNKNIHKALLKTLNNIKTTLTKIKTITLSQI